MTTLDTTNPLAILLADNNDSRAMMQAITDAQSTTVETKVAPKPPAKAALQGTSNIVREVRTETLEDGTVATYR